MPELKRYVAFLRAVNVGGRQVKSAQLVQACEDVGFSAPTPFLASGNVVFDCDGPSSKAAAKKTEQGFEAILEKSLEKHLKIKVEVFVRSLDEVTAIANSNPFELTADQLTKYTVNVILLKEPVSAARKQALLALRSDYDDFAFAKREAYWLCRGEKISESELFKGNRLNKALDMLNTMRNMRTFSRLSEKFT